MFKFDVSQQQVLQLDRNEHARIIGAPGSGKTTLLVETFVSCLGQNGWSESDLLVLTANRLVAADLRAQIERRLERAVGGTFVRTLSSLAFAVLQKDSALRGEQPPRLLTGPAHDEIVQETIAEKIAESLAAAGALSVPADVLLSDSFRAEIREMSRVLDDFALSPTALIHSLRSRVSPGVPIDLIEQWFFALNLIEGVQTKLIAQRPGELSASAMQRRAAEVLREADMITVPKLLLIDDAAELGEGGLALVSSLVERGTKVWAFGDPDTATGAFQGERTRLLAGLTFELQRKSTTNLGSATEQIVFLEQVHRHGTELRDLTSTLTGRIGAAGVGQQRAAAGNGEQSLVRFATVTTPAEQVGVIAHRIRAAHLGIGDAAPTPWKDIAIICRSRAEVKRISKLLAAQQVPTTVGAGGMVLREHQLVRELIRLLQHALSIIPLKTREVMELMGGVVGGLDPISLRRLKSALRLQEVRAAEARNEAPASAEEIIFDFFQHPGSNPPLDMRAARRLHRLASLSQAACQLGHSGATPREVLWQIWDGTGLASELQQQALDSRGARSEEAHKALDAVMGLFFALQRHEEQDSDRPIEQLLAELLLSAVPTDSLARKSEREVVTVTTPQGAIGKEFGLVCVLGVQDGSWPNLRARGSLLGVTALERWLRGEEALSPSRSETLHDELRLFALAASRAKHELLVVSLSNEDQHPGVFFSLGRRYGYEGQLPSTRLTLRGITAQMRRRLTTDLGDIEARDALCALAEAGVSGAHPNEWYGVLPPTSEAPLAEIETDPEATVSVSPSQMERAEKCPLDWVVSKLSGGSGDYRANIGTLLHYAMETAPSGVSGQQIFEQVRESWGALKFEAVWQEERALQDTEAMAGALAEYLKAFEQSQNKLLAGEASFVLPIEFARLRGTADRIEATPGEDGVFEITVVDLKTGRKAPTARELAQHAQLQAYQLGVLRGAFVDAEGVPIEAGRPQGAKLLFVHPNTVTPTRSKNGETYTEAFQSGLSEEQQREFEERVKQVGRVMAGSHFTAQLEHHCQNEYSVGGACKLHIIPSVGQA